jgi:hypothetical protein
MITPALDLYSWTGIKKFKIGINMPEYLQTLEKYFVECGSGHRPAVGAFICILFITQHVSNPDNTDLVNLFYI